MKIDTKLAVSTIGSFLVGFLGIFLIAISDLLWQVRIVLYCVFILVPLVFSILYENKLNKQHYEKTVSYGRIYYLITAELANARTKFPKATNLTVALLEEAGELAQAQLQGLSKDKIIKEAVQVAVIAIRIAEEGDQSLVNLASDERKA